MRKRNKMSMEIMNALFGEEFLKQKLDDERKFRSGLTKEDKEILDGKRPISVEYSDGTTINYKAGR